PAMLYYLMLFLTGAALCLSALLLRSRAGYYWQAIREDEDAAAALGVNTFRWKILAVTISGAMTAWRVCFQRSTIAIFFPNSFSTSVAPSKLFSARCSAGSGRSSARSLAPPCSLCSLTAPLNWLQRWVGMFRASSSCFTVLCFSQSSLLCHKAYGPRSHES